MKENGPRREKTCLRGFANNKGTDQPVHQRSLVCTLLLAYWEVSYLDLLRAKFQLSS